MGCLPRPTAIGEQHAEDRKLLSLATARAVLTLPPCALATNVSDIDEASDIKLRLLTEGHPDVGPTATASRGTDPTQAP